MKAIIVREFGPPDVLKLEETDRPEAKGTEVLVKVEAAGVNPVDTYLRSGVYPNPPKLPYTPGKDAAGTIDSVGAEVKEFKPGDRVYTAGSITGTYAEYTLCEAKDVAVLPDNVTFEEGAGIWTPYATAYRALFQKAHAKSGETVLIHGASGSVGLSAVQWAKNAGLRVFGTASSDEGSRLASDNGAEKVFDHSKDDHLAAILEETGGKGVDVIIEMLANVNLERDFTALAKFGRIVVVGSRGSLQFTPRLAMTKDATIFGMSLFNYSDEERLQIRDAIFKGLSYGYLSPVVAESIPLAEASSAHVKVIEEKAAGKIVLKP